jgi:uncharacterized protein with PIN domain
MHPLEAAEEVAKSLLELLQEPEVSQQLQETPAAPSTQQQQQQAVALTARGTIAVALLNEALRRQLQFTLSAGSTATGTAAVEPGLLLGTVLRHKAACAVGTCLAWTLRRPEQLQIRHLLASSCAAADGPSCAADGGLSLPTAAALWEQSSDCVNLMGLLLNAEQKSRQAACAAETLAAAMLQQLEESGK